jgi:hypothetical protein
VSKAKIVSIAALAASFSLVLMGASECNIGGKSGNETCEVTARTTTTITTRCKDTNGNWTGPAETDGVPSDLYPKCQVGAFYPVCKEK